MPQHIPQPIPVSLPEHLILFDSQCNLCNGWSRFVLNHDTTEQFTLCRAQSAAGQQILKALSMPLENFKTLLYIQQLNHGQTVYQQSDALIQIMARMPSPWHKLTCLRYLPRPVRDFTYRTIARNRYRLFGKPEQCLLPDRHNQHRFLEEFPR